MNIKKKKSLVITVPSHAEGFSRIPALYMLCSKVSGSSQK